MSWETASETGRVGCQGILREALRVSAGWGCFSSADSGQGALANGEQALRGTILDWRSEHDNTLRTLVDSTVLPHPNGPLLLRLTALIHQWLKRNHRGSVLLADSRTPFPPSLCLNSICSAGSRCDHGPWCLLDSFHDTALSPANSWP